MSYVENKYVCWIIYGKQVYSKKAGLLDSSRE